LDYRKKWGEKTWEKNRGEGKKKKGRHTRRGHKDKTKKKKKKVHGMPQRTTRPREVSNERRPGKKCLAIETNKKKSRKKTEGKQATSPHQRHVRGKNTTKKKAVMSEKLRLDKKGKGR